MSVRGSMTRSTLTISVGYMLVGSMLSACSASIKNPIVEPSGDPRAVVSIRTNNAAVVGKIPELTAGEPSLSVRCAGEGNLRASVSNDAVASKPTLSLRLTCPGSRAKSFPIATLRGGAAELRVDEITGQVKVLAEVVSK